MAASLGECDRIRRPDETQWSLCPERPFGDGRNRVTTRLELAG